VTGTGLHRPSSATSSSSMPSCFPSTSTPCTCTVTGSIWGWLLWGRRAHRCHKVRGLHSYWLLVYKLAAAQGAHHRVAPKRSARASIRWTQPRCHSHMQTAHYNYSLAHLTQRAAGGTPPEHAAADQHGGVHPVLLLSLSDQEPIVVEPSHLVTALYTPRACHSCWAIPHDYSPAVWIRMSTLLTARSDCRACR